MCGTTTRKKMQKIMLTAVLLGLGGGVAGGAVLLPQPVQAAPAAMAAATVDNASAQKAVEGYFNGLTTLTADFAQQSTGDAFTQEGTFTLKKPQQFAWHYTSPDDKKIISPGNGTLWFVDEARHQTTQLPANAGLARFFNAENSFRLDKAGVQIVNATRSVGPQGVPLLSVNLKATEKMIVTQQGNGLKTAQLIFSVAPNGALTLQRISVLDTVGTTTLVTFNHVKTGMGISAGVFAFVPPKVAK